MSAPYAHPQMGRVERLHGVRMATARVLLSYARVPSSFWPFATNQANVLHNNMPDSVDNERAPVCRFPGAPASADWSGFEIFGHLAMVWLDPQQRGSTAKQLAVRAALAIYLGRAWDMRGHHFYLVDEQKAVVAFAFRMDYSRPPPGLAFARAHSEELYHDLLRISEYELLHSPAIAETLAAELPLDLDALPVPLVPRGPPLQSPPVVGQPPAPAPALPAPAPAPALPPPVPLAEVGDGFDLVDHDAEELDPVHVRDDLAAPPRRVDQGDGQFIPPGHCSNTHCDLPFGHPGPCEDLLPAHDPDPLALGPPSSRLRSRHAALADGIFARMALVSRQGGFSVSESVAIRNFVFRTTVLDDQYRLGLGALAYVSAFNACLHIAQGASPPRARDVPIPKGLRQALASEHAEYWLEAVYREYNSILSHDVFRVVRRRDVPAGTNIMRNHFVFDVKHTSDGSIDKFKARLVADGNTQRFGVDFQSIFATVVRFATFRFALHIGAVRDYNLTSLDISTAFLHGDIDCECYMIMPEGLPREDSDGNELVCKLNKSLYGLRQSPRLFYEHLAASLLAFGFVRSDVDPCLFIYKSAAGDERLWVLVYVDDLVLMENSPALRERFVTFLQVDRGYVLTDGGELSWFLKIKITRDRPNRQVTLSQELYIQNLCESFSDYVSTHLNRTFDTPAAADLIQLPAPQRPDSDEALTDDAVRIRSAYMTLVGAFIWVSTCTRPDICFAVCVLSSYTMYPTAAVFTRLLRVLVYLRDTRSLVLTLGGTGPDAEVISVITDASHDPSISGVLAVCGSAVFNWICHRIRPAGHSSTQDEAAASNEGARDIIYARYLAEDFDVEVSRE